MACASCGESAGKCTCGSHAAPAVLEIVNEAETVLFRKVVIPASVGDETTNPPRPGLYSNTLLVYEASDEAYLYSSDCIPTKITDKVELKRLETLLGNEVAERKEADAELEEKIENIKGLKYEIVETLPETGEAGIIYLVPKTSEAPDFYDEYIWVNNVFEKIGSTEVELDDYVLKSEIFNIGQSTSGAKYIDGVKIAAAPGMPATASGYGVAIGNGATSGSAPSIAVGSSASSTSNGYEAIGNGSASSGQGRAYAGGVASNGAIAFGGTATNAGVSVGPGGNASNQGIAIGSNSSNKATATGGNNSIAIGYNTSSTNGGYEAIGAGSNASNSGRAYAGGTAYNTSSIAVGGTSNGGGSISFGVSSSATGGGSSAVGFQATSSSQYTTAVGYSSKASAIDAVAVGAGAQATASESIAIRGTASNNNAVSIGASSTASSYGAVALGQSAAAKGYLGVAIGPSATVDSSTNSAVAIGHNSRATEDATASFGSSSFKRRLVNVAPGTADNDAVIVSQLNGLADASLSNISEAGEAKIKEIAGGGTSSDTYPNVTIIDNPTINNGQASDFSTDDYLQFPFILDLHDNEAVIDFCFTTGEQVATQQNLIDSKFGVALAISNNTGLMAVSEDGTSWAKTATGTFTFQPHTTYFARLVINEGNVSGVIKTYLSTDGVEYTEDMSIEADGTPFPTTHYIGGANSAIVGHTAYPFAGIIDLNKCKMTINGELFWEGMDSLGLKTRADISLSNIDAAGEQRIKDIAGSGGGGEGKKTYYLIDLGQDGSYTSPTVCATDIDALFGYETWYGNSHTWDHGYYTGLVISKTPEPSPAKGDNTDFTEFVNDLMNNKNVEVVVLGLIAGALPTTGERTEIARVTSVSYHGDGSNPATEVTMSFDMSVRSSGVMIPLTTRTTIHFAVEPHYDYSTSEYTFENMYAAVTKQSYGTFNLFYWDADPDNEGFFMFQLGEEYNFNFDSFAQGGGFSYPAVRRPLSLVETMAKRGIGVTLNFQDEIHGGAISRSCPGEFMIHDGDPDIKGAYYYIKFTCSDVNIPVGGGAATINERTIYLAPNLFDAANASFTVVKIKNDY